ncbi:MAG: oligosaccharide flippase family protein [Bacteroidales bacterium]|nr:oligosaccharide flippase family protein [Bacteroidales bacterium]
MEKKLLSGLFWVLLLNLLIKPFWFLGIEVGVQNAVGAEQYGFYFGIFNLAYIFNILLDLGITNFNTRNIAQHPHLISKHFSYLLSIKLLLLALYMVVTFSTGLLLGYHSRQFYLLAFLSFNQFLNSFILYLRSNFEGLLLFKWDSVISILDRVIMIAICGALLWLPQHPTFKIEYFVYAQTAAYLLTALMALTVLVGKTGFGRLRLSRPFTLAILKQSLPFALLVLLMASYNRLDPILLQKLSPAGLGDHNAGIYASAFRLLDVLTMVTYLVSVPLLPIYARLTKSPTEQATHQELVSTTRIVTSLMLVYSITAAITLASMDSQLMELLYTDHTAESAAVFRILVYGIIPISMTYVFGTLLTAAGRLRQLNTFALCTLVINIAVNLLCIPRWGAVGSAWASLVAQSFMAITQLWAAVKIFHLRPSWGYILKIAFFTLSITSCTLLPCSDHSWWLRPMIIGVIALVMAVLLKLIDINELKTIINNQEQQ